MPSRRPSDNRPGAGRGPSARHREPRPQLSESERAAIREAGAEDARRSRVAQGLPERIEDPAAIAVLAALLRTVRSATNQESTSHEGNPAA
jgi:hypothetical protein